MRDPPEAVIREILKVKDFSKLRKVRRFKSESKEPAENVWASHKFTIVQLSKSFPQVFCLILGIALQVPVWLELLLFSGITLKQRCFIISKSVTDPVIFT